MDFTLCNLVVYSGKLSYRILRNQSNNGILNITLRIILLFQTILRQTYFLFWIWLIYFANAISDFNFVEIFSFTIITSSIHSEFDVDICWQDEWFYTLWNCDSQTLSILFTTFNFMILLFLNVYICYSTDATLCCWYLYTHPFNLKIYMYLGLYTDD